MALEVITVINDPVPSNCYILYDKSLETDKCIIIDPGSELCIELDNKLTELSLHPEYIILTHEHFDHIWGCNFLIGKYSPKLISSFSCSEAIINAKKNHSLFYDQKGFSTPPADICVEDIQFELKWHDRIIRFFTAKGHTLSGICIWTESFLFTGDSLIKDIKTVTKLHTGSTTELKETIKNIAGFKGKKMIIYPGHGESFELDTYNLNLAFGI